MRFLYSIGHFRKKRETEPSELFTKTSGSFTRDRLKKKMAKLKQQRRRRQRGRQKAVALNWQNNNFFVHFFAAFARLRREIALFYFF